MKYKIPEFIEDDFPVPLPELIDRLVPGADYNLTGNSYTGLDWQDPRPEPAFTDLLRVLEDPQKDSESPDWDGLMHDLAELVGFAVSTKNSNAFTLLHMTLTTYRNPDLLLTSLQQVKLGLPEDLTMLPATVDFVNQALIDNGFDFSI